MKKILTTAAAIIGVLSLGLVSVTSVMNSSFNSSAADSLKKQDISYTELVGRINQSDCGFTISSNVINTKSLNSSSAPLSGSAVKGFQFYYIELSKWSSGNDGTDKPIDDWFLNWFDSSLAALRKNGGSCIIRGCYDTNGTVAKSEPATFEMLQTHQEQLASVISKYPDIVVGIECGMAGQFGEMHDGRYVGEEHKRQILDKWLTSLPDTIPVGVRTLDEYIYYVNNSDIYESKYRSKTVNGIFYPEKITRGNCAAYTFENEVFNRIGFYNDGMIQDNNDAGTFYSSRENYVSLVNHQSANTIYGGEFSGASGYVRTENAIWQPLNAMTEFYNTHLTYYHGGNSAYELKGQFKNGGSCTCSYSSSDKATTMANQYTTWLNELGSGMTGSATVSGTSVKYTYGGWSTAKVGDALITKLRTDGNVEADLSAYKGKSVATFFEDHLGYRLVLKESYLPESVSQGGLLTLRGKIDNTGFSNISDDKVTEIILSDNSNGDNMYVLRTDMNVGSWVGGSSNDYELSLSLPDDIKKGNYEVYLRIASENPNGNTNEASCVRFANAGQFAYSVQPSVYTVTSNTTVNIIYNPTVCGNYIGTFTVS